jgi:hypothetical protein
MCAVEASMVLQEPLSLTSGKWITTVKVNHSNYLILCKDCADLSSSFSLHSRGGLLVNNARSSHQHADFDLTAENLRHASDHNRELVAIASGSEPPWDSGGLRPRIVTTSSVLLEFEFSFPFDDCFRRSRYLIATQIGLTLHCRHFVYCWTPVSFRRPRCHFYVGWLKLWCPSRMRYRYEQLERICI